MMRPPSDDPELSVLRLRLTIRPDRVLRRSAGGLAAHGVEATYCYGGVRTRLAELSPAELHLPNEASAELDLRRAPSAALPTDFLIGLRNILAQRQEPAAPLWLEFLHPVGTLPLVTWEQLLREVPVPVFRLGYHPVAPACGWRDQQLALCISAVPPQATERVAAFAIELVDALTDSPEQRTLHIFADQAIAQILVDRVQLPAARDIRIYNPNTAPEAAPLTDSESLPRIESRWLQWVGRELGEVGIDGIHFLCPAHRSLQHGQLLFATDPAEEPAREPPSRVGPQELARFLTLLGAWSVGLARPSESASPMGLRLLADQLARSRVGTVLVHDGGPDLSPALRAVFDFLYASAPLPSAPPEGDRPVLYCHPEFARRTHTTAVDFSGPELETAPPAAPSSIPHGQLDRMPAWQLSVKRSLERSTADLMDIRGAAEETPAHQGVTRALEFIARLVDTKDLSDSPTSVRPTLLGDLHASFDREEA